MADSYDPTDEFDGEEPKFGKTTQKQYQYASRIDTVEVDADEVVKHHHKNTLNQGTYTPRSFKVGSPDDAGVSATSVGVNPVDENPTARYPEAPHPIWISPRGFIDEDNLPSDFPTQSQSRRMVDRESGLPNRDEDGFDEAVDEWYEEWVEMWEQEVRMALKDEVVIYAPRGMDGKVYEVTASVDYADE